MNSVNRNPKALRVATGIRAAAKDLENEAFLKTLRENPDDDTAHQVYGDFREEHYADEHYRPYLNLWQDLKQHKERYHKLLNDWRRRGGLAETLPPDERRKTQDLLTQMHQEIEAKEKQLRTLFRKNKKTLQHLPHLQEQWTLQQTRTPHPTQNPNPLLLDQLRGKIGYDIWRYLQELENPVLKQRWEGTRQHHWNGNDIQKVMRSLTEKVINTLLAEKRSSKYRLHRNWQANPDQFKWSQAELQDAIEATVVPFLQGFDPANKPTRRPGRNVPERPTTSPQDMANRVREVRERMRQREQQNQENTGGDNP